MVRADAADRHGPSARRRSGPHPAATSGRSPSTSGASPARSRASSRTRRPATCRRSPTRSPRRSGLVASGRRPAMPGPTGGADPPRRARPARRRAGRAARRRGRRHRAQAGRDDAAPARVPRATARRPRRPAHVHRRSDARDRRFAGHRRARCCAPAARAQITALCLIAAPEGVEPCAQTDPDVRMFTAALDPKLERARVHRARTRRRRRPLVRSGLRASPRAGGVTLAARPVATLRRGSSPRYRTGDAEIDQQIAELIARLGDDVRDSDLVFELDGVDGAPRARLT